MRAPRGRNAQTPARTVARGLPVQEVTVHPINAVGDLGAGTSRPAGGTGECHGGDIDGSDRATLARPTRSHRRPRPHPLKGQAGHKRVGFDNQAVIGVAAPDLRPCFVERIPEGLVELFGHNRFLSHRSSDDDRNRGDSAPLGRREQANCHYGKIGSQRPGSGTRRRGTATQGTAPGAGHHTGWSSVATGISVSTLSRLESGQRKANLELLLPLARAYQVPLDDLIAATPTNDPRGHARPITRR